MSVVHVVRSGCLFYQSDLNGGAGRELLEVEAIRS
jgi:hypothetical protein